MIDRFHKPGKGDVLKCSECVRTQYRHSDRSQDRLISAIVYEADADHIGGVRSMDDDGMWS
jgi:hypothetical protein